MACIIVPKSLNLAAIQSGHKLHKKGWMVVLVQGGINAKANEIKEDVIKKMNRGAEEYDHLYRWFREHSP